MQLLLCEMSCTFLSPQGVICTSSKLNPPATCLKILARWTDQYGPVYKWRLGPKTILVVTDPVEVLKLCSKEANLPKFALAYKALNTVSSVLQGCFAHQQINMDITLQFDV